MNSGSYLSKPSLPATPGIQTVPSDAWIGRATWVSSHTRGEPLTNSHFVDEGLVHSPLLKCLLSNGGRPAGQGEPERGERSEREREREEHRRTCEGGVGGKEGRGGDADAGVKERERRKRRRWMARLGRMNGGGSSLLRRSLSVAARPRRTKDRHHSHRPRRADRRIQLAAGDAVTNARAAMKRAVVS